MQRTSVNNVYSVVQTLQLAQLADEVQSVRASSGREDDAEDDLELKYKTRIYLCHPHRNS